MRYFKKELLTQNQPKSRHGKSIPFQTIPGNTGIIALNEEVPEQKELLEDLLNVVGTRGILEIDQQRYEDLKKNRAQFKSATKLSSSGGPVRVHQGNLNPKRPAAVASVGVAVKDEIAKQVAEAIQNTKLPGGDTVVSEAGIPPAKPAPKLGRPRKARVDESGPHPMPQLPGEMVPA